MGKRSNSLAATLLAAATIAFTGGRALAAAPSSPAPAPLPAAAGPGVEGLAAYRGELVGGVRVLAFGEPGPGPKVEPLAVSAGTDASGRYRLALKPGSYHLIAVKSSGAPWPFPAAKGDLFCYHLGNPVVVEPGRMTRVGFNMVQIGDRPAPLAGDGAGIAGHVRFEGKPLGRAYVYVYSDAAANFRGPGRASVPADEDGRFRIKLPPGTYYVLARKRQSGGMHGPPGKNDHGAYFPGNPVRVSQGSFQQLALETTTRIDLLDEIWNTGEGAAGWLEGSVTESGGKPAVGLYVLFYAGESLSGTPAFVAGPTDAGGRFRVRAAAGTFHLLARSNLGGPLEPGEWHGRTVIGPGRGGGPGGIGEEIRLTVTRYRGE